ncbi:MAG: FtsW/RodA/SpoVE family cell cycle protein [Bacteroidales bacterium]|nr:FtsW/RodA/SpoVE family cell cycle protein [Bacteroidales bacterium]
MKHKISQWFGGDKVIWFVMIALCICSMVLIYSSASSQLFNPTERHNLFPYFRSHGVFLLLGVAIAMVLQDFDYRRLAPLSRLCYLAAVVILLCTLFLGGKGSGASHSVNRAIVLFGHEIQTFYIVVLLTVIYAAHSIAHFGSRINETKRVYLPLLLTVGLVIALMMTQDFSTSFILLTTFLFMLFISELKFRTLGITVGVLAAVVLLLIATSGFGISRLSRFETAHGRVERFFRASDEVAVKDRVAAMSDQEVDFTRQDILFEGAVATGGILPVNGPGTSVYRKTSQSYSDGIFAIAVEEYGVLISSLIIILYLLLFYRIFLMVSHVPTPFGAYLAGGLGFWIVCQALLHISVCVGVTPNTGQTLPMVSWGNMSILITSINFGLLLNISKSKKRKDEKRLQTKGEEDE